MPANRVARSFVENAAGCGVFMNFGMKFLFMGGGKGRGIVVNNATGDETFMKMIETEAAEFTGKGTKYYRDNELNP